MTVRVEKTKSGKGYRITVVESDEERARREERRRKDFEQELARARFTRGQREALTADSNA